ncbi:unnamed protein product [Candidula unifasciata]|uniref:Uncharacterized protein n=1 Tax=Candidula unifasciata TaxID=100452 RepID=A0A8S3YUN5_9EUPU|nr:unnamed protein product [Candidula unifasciata]
MLTQANQPLLVSGLKMTADDEINSTVATSIQQMKQELAAKRAENHKLTDQVNCLISLIKRSWTGDVNAVLHLSNIVGMEPPPHLSMSAGQDARPNSQLYPATMTRCEKHWERLTIKLLNKEYLSVQREIREYQQRHFESRQAYMDAVLQDHQQTMSRTALHRKSDLADMMEETDSKFIRYNKALQAVGSGAAGTFRQVQSAGQRRKVPTHNAFVNLELSLRDIVGGNPPSSPPRILKPSANAYRRPLSSLPHRRLPPNTYNDPARYSQGNVFALNENDGIKEPRAVSASSLRAGDIIRSRPRSGSNVKKHLADQSRKPVFVTQKGERPLKYETVHPVDSKPRSAKHRGSSAGGLNTRVPGHSKVLTVSLTDVISASSKPTSSTVAVGYSEDDPNDEMNKKKELHEDKGNEDVTVDHDHSDNEIPSSPADKPPVAVRAKSAFQRRPAFIDEYAKDEQKLNNIEEDFQKNVVNLQKKLGISDSGMVNFD